MSMSSADFAAQLARMEAYDTQPAWSAIKRCF